MRGNGAVGAKVQLADFSDPAFWRAVCPELSVTDVSDQCDLSSLPQPMRLPGGVSDSIRQQIDREGACVVTPEQLPWQHVHWSRLASAVEQLMQKGWPPTFLLMYDEVWHIIHQLDAVMQATTGNTCNFDILAWHIDPRLGGAGFSPHRDRQPDSAPDTFRPDGSAMYTTAWLPLVPATPDNSCLYVIPRWADPGYFEGDDDQGPGPLAAALRDKEAYQSIRALPADPGAAVIFTHRTIHWGSKGRPGHPHPRISLSFGCSGPEYEPPYFERCHLPLPPLGLRAALACGQMIVYHERFHFSRRQLLQFHSVFKSHISQFHPTYQASVLKEFVAACKELEAGAAAAAAAAAGPAASTQATSTAQLTAAAASPNPPGAPPGPAAALQAAAAVARPVAGQLTEALADSIQTVSSWAAGLRAGAQGLQGLPACLVTLASLAGRAASAAAVPGHTAEQGLALRDTRQAGQAGVSDAWSHLAQELEVAAQQLRGKAGAGKKARGSGIKAASGRGGETQAPAAASSEATVTTSVLDRVAKSCVKGSSGVGNAKQLASQVVMQGERGKQKKGRGEGSQRGQLVEKGGDLSWGKEEGEEGEEGEGDLVDAAMEAMLDAEMLRQQQKQSTGTRARRREDDDNENQDDDDDDFPMFMDFQDDFDTAEYVATDEAAAAPVKTATGPKNDGGGEQEEEEDEEDKDEEYGFLHPPGDGDARDRGDGSGETGSDDAFSDENSDAGGERVMEDSDSGPLGRGLTLLYGDATETKVAAVSLRLEDKFSSVADARREVPSRQPTGSHRSGLVERPRQQVGKQAPARLHQQAPAQQSPAAKLKPIAGRGLAPGKRTVELPGPVAAPTSKKRARATTKSSGEATKMTRAGRQEEAPQTKRARARGPDSAQLHTTRPAPQTARPGEKARTHTAQDLSGANAQRVQKHISASSECQKPAERAGSGPKPRAQSVADLPARPVTARPRSTKARHGPGNTSGKARGGPE